MAQQVSIEVDAGFADLVKQLTDDSKRLVADEVRLAKLETAEGVHRAGHGALWLGAAFGALVVALVAATLLLATLIGRIASGHYWIGALITAAIELGLGFWLVKRGLSDYKSAPYSLPETRSGLQVIKGARTGQ